MWSLGLALAGVKLQMSESQRTTPRGLNWRLLLIAPFYVKPLLVLVLRYVSEVFVRKI